MGKTKKIGKAYPVSKEGDFKGYPRPLRNRDFLTVPESQVRRGKIKGRGRGHKGG